MEHDTPSIGLKQQRRADLLGVGAVICWSTVATAFKLSLRYLTPAQLLLFAAAVSWLFLGAILLWRGKFTAAFRDLRRRPGHAVLMGLLNPCLYYLFLLRAYDLLPAQEAQAINYTWALTLSLLSVPFLGHVLGRNDILGTAAAYSGVFVIATRGDLGSLEFANPAGVLLALFSTLLWASYWLLGTRDKGEVVAGLFKNFSMALPILALYCTWTGELTEINWYGLYGAVYIGIFELGLPFILWTHAMKRTASTVRTANLIFLSPLLSLVFIALILGERILPSTLAGLALILGGIALQRLRCFRKG